MLKLFLSEPLGEGINDAELILDDQPIVHILNTTSQSVSSAAAMIIAS